MILVNLLFLTSNKGKIKEVREFFEKNKLDIKIDYESFDYEEPRSDSLEKIVSYKINQVKNKKNYDFILSEDSGIFIDALNDFPGAYSALVFNKIGLNGFVKLMKGVKNRRAYYKSCFALYISKENTKKIFCGKVEGNISEEKRGDGGFGFDPIFIPKGYNKTFGEIPELKKEISHRTRALEKLVEFLKENITA